MSRARNSCVVKPSWLGSAVGAFAAGVVAADLASSASTHGSETFFASDVVHFRVDDFSSSAAWTPFDAGVVTRCVGSSHAATALRASWREQLTKVRHDIGFEYIRFHGLLDDDMSAVIKGSMHAARDDDRGGSGNCTYVDDQDFADEGGPELKANSPEECCKLCYTASTGLPQPCIASVWAPWDGGKCYLKLNRAHPVTKRGSGLKACVTDRQMPKPYRYSFINIFSVFDFLRSIGMRPIVEVGFMPSMLAVRPEDTVFWYRGGISPPKDYGEWRDLISSLLRALIDRYGKDEVRQWYFEVWNEPNCGFFVEGKCCGAGCGNQTAYMEMYAETYRSLKEIDPEVRVGGPATAQLLWLGDFLQAAESMGVWPDFVSSHLYPTDPGVPRNRDGFADSIESAMQEISTAAAKTGHQEAPPLIMTEFNCGLGINCMDDPYAGSFVAYNMLRAQKTRSASPMWSYWTFSDIFEEQGQVPSEFSQAFGLQSISGVPKPVYRTMELLRRLHGKQLPVRRMDATAAEEEGANVVVTAKEADGNVTCMDLEVLIVSHSSAKPRPSPTTRPSRRNVTIEFPSSMRLVSNVDVRRVDAEHGNALQLYKQMGSPQYPTALQLKGLVEASQVQVTTALTPSQTTGTFQVTISLPTAAAVASLSLRVAHSSPIARASDGGPAKPHSELWV